MRTDVVEASVEDALDAAEALSDPEGWLAEGRRLHRVLQNDVSAFAEVRPEFGPESG